MAMNGRQFSMGKTSHPWTMQKQSTVQKGSMLRKSEAPEHHHFDRCMQQNCSPQNLRTNVGMVYPSLM